MPAKKAQLAIPEDQSIVIRTSLCRELGLAEVMKFKITAFLETDEDELAVDGSPVAMLTGYLTGFDFDAPLDWFENFDKDDDAAHAFEFLTTKTDMLAAAIGADSSILTIEEMVESVAVIENIQVPLEWRGRGLGLRLLREAHVALGRNGLLTLVRCLPSEQRPNREAHHLAGYLSSDPHMSFRIVDTEDRVPWLAFFWEGPFWNHTDELIWDPEAYCEAQEHADGTQTPSANLH